MNKAAKAFKELYIERKSKKRNYPGRGWGKAKLQFMRARLLGERTDEFNRLMCLNGDQDLQTPRSNDYTPDPVYQALAKEYRSIQGDSEIETRKRNQLHNFMYSIETRRMDQGTYGLLSELNNRNCHLSYD